jgi:clan AA aspartic protease
MGSRDAVSLTAIVDTGFDGDVCLPTALAVGLGLELSGETRVELADGSVKKALHFAGSVVFLGERRPAQIYLTDSDDALIGTSLLADCRLVVDFPTGDVRVTRRRPRGGRANRA